MIPARDLTPSNEWPEKIRLPDISPNEIPSVLAKEIGVNADAFGRLRREMIWSLGEDRTHGIMARWGLACGLTETLQSISTPHLTGLGDPIEKNSMELKDEITIEVPNSMEASAHLEFFQPLSKSPQCWLLAGYLTGRISGLSGRSLFMIETRCVARGDACCQFVGRTREMWSSDQEYSLQYFDEDNMALELIQTREQLKLTKDRYQNLFEQASTPILIIDPETGVNIDVNLATEELTGFTKRELLSMTIFDIRPQSEHQLIMNRMKALLAGETLMDEEIHILRKDGSERTVLTVRKLMEYGGQKVIQSILRDITDLKLSEQKEKMLQDQLARSERLSSIGRLAASVAHEIKNPLGAIRNAIYYLKSAVLNTPVADNDPQVKEIMKLAEEEVDSAVRIIEELLDFSRVITLIPRRTQINELLERIPSLIRLPDFIKTNWDLDITLPSAMVDPDRLSQVFMNITNNAVQSMPNGGSLTIRSRLEYGSKSDQEKEQQFILIMFEDTGCGIQPQHLKKIFEPLFTTKAQGTGLGLAITSNIIEKHGGSIAVTSQPNKGTCFTVKLPLNIPQTSEDSSNGHQ